MAVSTTSASFILINFFTSQLLMNKSQQSISISISFQDMQFWLMELENIFLPFHRYTLFFSNNLLNTNSLVIGWYSLVVESMFMRPTKSSVTCNDPQNVARVETWEERTGVSISFGMTIFFRNCCRSIIRLLCWFISVFEHLAI